VVVDIPQAPIAPSKSVTSFMANWSISARPRSIRARSSPGRRDFLRAGWANVIRQLRRSARGLERAGRAWRAPWQERLPNKCPSTGPDAKAKRAPAARKLMGLAHIGACAGGWCSTHSTDKKNPMNIHVPT